MVPMMQGSLLAGPALRRQEKTSPKAEAWCRLSKIITEGSSETPLAMAACSAMWPRYCRRSFEDLWSTLRENGNGGEIVINLE